MVILGMRWLHSDDSIENPQDYKNCGERYHLLYLIKIKIENFLDINVINFSNNAVIKVSEKNMLENGILCSEEVYVKNLPVE